MMKKKGQLTLSQTIILAFALIVGAVFAVAIADQQAVLTETQDVTNQSVTLPANGSSIDLNGQAVVGTLTAVANGTTIDSGNYTITNYVDSDDGRTAQLTIVDTEFQNTDANLTYEYEPSGYNTDASSRGIAALPLLFFILALLGFGAVGIRKWMNE